jgi:hypothetical protein
MSSEKNMLTISPEELLSVLRKRFPITIPETIETPEQMQEAGNLLGVYTSNYVYLENMRIAANLVKRKLKREGRPKNEIEDAISREEIFATYSDIAKNSYKAVSRMIATRQQVLFELRMTDSIQAYPDPNGKR